MIHIWDYYLAYMKRQTQCHGYRACLSINSFFSQYVCFIFTCVRSCEPNVLHCYQQVRWGKKSWLQACCISCFTFESPLYWSSKEKLPQRIPEIVAVYSFPQLHQKPPLLKPFKNLHLLFKDFKIVAVWTSICWAMQGIANQNNMALIFMRPENKRLV